VAASAPVSASSACENYGALSSANVADGPPRPAAGIEGPAQLAVTSSPTSRLRSPSTEAHSVACGRADIKRPPPIFIPYFYPIATLPLIPSSLLAVLRKHRCPYVRNSHRVYHPLKTRSLRGLIGRASSPAIARLFPRRGVREPVSVGAYLAAITLIETRFGSIDGLSTAGAQVRSVPAVTFAA